MRPSNSFTPGELEVWNKLLHALTRHPTRPEIPEGLMRHPDFRSLSRKFESMRRKVREAGNV